MAQPIKVVVVIVAIFVVVVVDVIVVVVTVSVDIVVTLPNSSRSSFPPPEPIFFKQSFNPKFDYIS